MRSFKRIVGAASLAAAIAISLVVGTASSASSASKSYALKASLSTRAIASLKDATGARGTLTGKWTVAGKKSSFTWTLTFRNLSGSVRRADIYYSATGKASSLALPLCVKCQVPRAHGAYVGPYVATQTFMRHVLHGSAYVIVRTKKNPNGEIRGRIKATSA